MIAPKTSSDSTNKMNKAIVFSINLHIDIWRAGVAGTLVVGAAVGVTSGDLVVGEAVGDAMGDAVVGDTVGDAMGAAVDGAFVVVLLVATGDAEGIAVGCGVPGLFFVLLDVVVLLDGAALGARDTEGDEDAVVLV